MGLRVAKFRRLWNVDEQFLLTATVQNIKRMVKLLHRGNKEAREAIQRVANFSNLEEGLFFDHYSARKLYHPLSLGYGDYQSL